MKKLKLSKLKIKNENGKYFVEIPEKVLKSLDPKFKDKKELFSLSGNSTLQILGQFPTFIVRLSSLLAVVTSLLRPIATQHHQ